MARKYEIRYGLLDSNIIFNENGLHDGNPFGWNEKTITTRNERWHKRIKEIDGKTGFYTKLEASILKEGFRNPILVDAGFYDKRHGYRLPNEMIDNHSKILTCNFLGGSRLMIAQKHDLMIPCVISDFVGRFSEFKLLETKEDILSCFSDPPFDIKFRPFGLRLRSPLDLNETWGND